MQRGSNGNVRGVVLGMGEADRHFVSNLCHHHSCRFYDVVVALELAPLLVPRALLRLPASLTSAKPSTARYDKAHRSVLMPRSSWSKM
jgi:hypothetical protein